MATDEAAIKPIKAMNLDLKITEEMIEKGIRNNSNKCMVAEAVKVEFPDAKAVTVDLATIRLTRSGYRYVYLTPRKVAEFIVAFDAGDDLEPFKTRLRAPVQIHKSSDQAKKNQDKKKTAAPKPQSEPSVTEPTNQPVPNPPATKTAPQPRGEMYGPATVLDGPGQGGLGDTVEKIKVGGQPAIKLTPEERGKRGRPRTTRRYGIRGLRINQDRAAGRGLFAPDTGL